MRAVRVKAPATTANLGSGFDAVGMALDLYNEVELRESDRTVIAIDGEGSDTLPRDTSNLVYRSIQKVASRAGMTLPALSLKCTNRVPLARGMGSSAAAIAAGMVAANAALQAGLTAEEILELAVGIERHPDNVAPALYGGVVVSCIDSVQGVRSVALPAPDGLIGVIAVPSFRLSTAKARATLPETVPHRDAVFNLGRAALLTACLQQHRYDLLSIAMADKLHQPYRAPLVPGLEAVVRAAVDAGAFGAAMSGAGPSVIALCADTIPDGGAFIADRMRLAFEANGVDCFTIVTRPTAIGALGGVEHLPTRV